MLSIQKITGFVNDCVTFRQKTTFHATSSGLFSTRALVRPSGRIAPAAVSAILVSVGPASSYTSTENSTTLRTMWPSESWAAVAAMPSATPACGSRVMPRYFWISSLQRAAISERKERKGETQHSQKKRIYVQYTIRPDKKQPEYGDPAKSSGWANKRNSFCHRCAMPPIPLLALSCHLPRPGEAFSRREALARRRSVPFCQMLPL